MTNLRKDFGQRFPLTLKNQDFLKPEEFVKLLL